LSEQFQQALTYAAQTIDASVKNSDITGQTNTFSVTGHSLGGGIAQAIAYTFGLNGGVSSILLKALGYFSLSEAIKAWYSLLATMALAPGASKVTPFKPKV
jgi:pimeloyl-ACP methyl ester carboxylesterase